MFKKNIILVIGSSGMLGRTLSRYFFEKHLKIYGSQRTKKENNPYKTIYLKKINKNTLLNVIKKIKPNFVVNCAGRINHKINKRDRTEVFEINSYLPKILTEISKKYNFKLIHISTDCVFSGNKGNYKENDIPDATDIYGISKFLGEIIHPNAVIIRTSIIGHEYKSKSGLLEWFLNRKNRVIGFKNFYFTGLTTLELSKIIFRYFIKKNFIENGLIHIGGRKISKFYLLNKIKECYNKNTKITCVLKPKFDKSLNSSKFKRITAYKNISTQMMINEMKLFNEKFF